MSHFHISDLSKPGTLDVTVDGTTVTLNYLPHVVDKCGCDKCKSIVKKKAEEAKKAEEKKKAEEAKKKAEEDKKKAEEAKKKKQADLFMAHLYGHPHPHAH
ncbi:hypothetical protein H4R20_003795 [Coemansia guatemalensis]|uniref:HMA domain-containing protein n=1 Tax=Coemansia guatemalensis TaxID=2761395 RepID=A0A9W8LR30_9FUNG|nr:hypothetical protein H4R20_003795 [Coemansia guatemalensis]